MNGTNIFDYQNIPNDIQINGPLAWVYDLWKCAQHSGKDFDDFLQLPSGNKLMRYAIYAADRQAAGVREFMAKVKHGS